MVKAGIIDSFKVIRTALVDAASASLLLATTEAAIIDAQGAKNPLKSAFHLRSAIEKSSAKLDQEKAQERLSKLSGGVAVFKDGGAIETEVAKRKDRVTDYLNATRAAVEESIIAGGGVALLYAPKVLKDLQTANEELKL